MCTLWVRTNVSKAMCVVVYSKDLNVFFVGSKSRSIGESPDVVQFENTEFKITNDLVLTEKNQDFDAIEDYSSLVSCLRRYDEKKQLI